MGDRNEKAENPQWDARRQRLEERRFEAEDFAPPKSAELVRLDEANDLALIKLPSTEDYTFLKISREQLQLGDSIAVIGYQSGSELTLIFGNVSSLSAPGGKIVVTAPLTLSHAGSPVLNKNGAVVAVVSRDSSPLYWERDLLAPPIRVVTPIRYASEMLAAALQDVR